MRPSDLQQSREKTLEIETRPFYRNTLFCFTFALLLNMALNSSKTAVGSSAPQLTSSFMSQATLSNEFGHLVNLIFPL